MGFIASSGYVVQIRESRIVVLVLADCPNSNVRCAHE